MSKENLLKFILVILPALLPVLLRNYGLEVADSGWAAVLTRDYFSRPEMVGQASPWFLTWTIGALLSNGNGMQLTQLRLFTFLPILLSAVAAWTAFSAYGYRAWVATVGVFVAGLAAYSSFSLYFLNYNTISAAFATLAFSSLFLSNVISKTEGSNPPGARVFRRFCEEFPGKQQEFMPMLAMLAELPHDSARKRQRTSGFARTRRITPKRKDGAR